MRFLRFFWAWAPPLYRRVMSWDVSIRAAWIAGILGLIGAIIAAPHLWTWAKGVVNPPIIEHVSPAADITPAADKAPQRAGRPTTIEYGKPSGGRGAQTIYPMRCVDGPADGVWHPLLVDPTEMLQIGSPFVWVYDVQEHRYLPELSDADRERLREEYRKGWRGSTVYVSEVPHETKMQVTGRSRYSLEQSADGGFLLRYAGGPAPSAYGKKVEDDQGNILKVQTPQGNVTAQRVYPLNCTGGPNDRKSFQLLADPQVLLQLGKSIVWVDVISPCPLPRRTFIGDETRSGKPQLVELSLYELIVTQGATISLEHRGDVRAVDYLRVTLPGDAVK
jgi:hypothetical protein